jgi:hypothetical protein
MTEVSRPYRAAYNQLLNLDKNPGVQALLDLITRRVAELELVNDAYPPEIYQIQFPLNKALHENSTEIENLIRSSEEKDRRYNKNISSIWGVIRGVFPKEITERQHTGHKEAA